MFIKHLDDLITYAKKQGPRTLVVACAEDESVLNAVSLARKQKMVTPVLSGNKSSILEICKRISFPTNDIEILDVQDENKVTQKAIQYIHEGKGHILMKGMIPTGMLLKAVLDQEKGLREEALLSHFALFESPYYHKLFGVTDAAMNISPNIEEKKSMIENAVKLLHKFKLQNPKVAIVCPVEKPNRNIQSTIDAEILKQMNKAGTIAGCTIEGPLALDNAISKKAALQKGIKNKVVGEADLLVPHDLDAANILYKAINFLGGGKCAAMITGAKVPIVLTSRVDDEHTKLLSIALACLMV